MSFRFLRNLLSPKSSNPQLIFSIATRLFSACQRLGADSFPDIPTSAYYDGLVHAAGRDRDLETLRHLLNKRVGDGCFNTADTFSFIVNTSDSLSILDDLIETISRLDEGFHRKQAYDSLVARLCKLQRIEESLRVVDFMARGPCRLTAITFHPILNCLTRKNKVEDAWRVIDKMRQLGASPDLTAFNYLLTAHCVNGKLAAACEIVKRIEEEGMRANSRTYDALVLGACRTGKVEGALVLLRSMEDDGLPALYSTHMHVINALLKLGYYDQAVKFVRAYAGRDNGLDTENYGVLAMKLINLKKLDRAKVVLEEMRERGLAMGDKLKENFRLLCLQPEG
uniref:Pentatricopeptide repeat-containing protein At3g56030 n=1 Tax=Rhizophora mucronata TaxID=61149 RepID=A0A2P2Q5D6_RHIMU